MNLDYTIELPPELMEGTLETQKTVMDTREDDTQKREPIVAIGLSRPRALPMKAESPPASMRDTTPVRPALTCRRLRSRRRRRSRKALRKVLLAAAIVLFTLVTIATIALAALVVMPSEAGAQERPQPLDAATVQTVVQKHQKKFGACYESALARTPDLEGTVEVAFNIEPNGEVKKARIESSTIEDAVFSSCITDELTKMRFPRSTRSVTIRYPFVFSPPTPAPAAAIMADSVGASAFRTSLRHDPEVQACYDAALTRNEDLSGRLIVEFTLSAQGRVEDARVLETTLDDDMMTSCVVQAMAKVSFPAYSGKAKTTVSYPFMFKPE